MPVISPRPGLSRSRPAAGPVDTMQSRGSDAATLWPLVHLRRLLRDEAARLYGACPSPERRARLGRASRALADAECALAATRRPFAVPPADSRG